MVDSEGVSLIILASVSKEKAGCRMNGMFKMNVFPVLILCVYVFVLCN